MPIIIKIVAYGVFPQVYLCIPKGKLHQHHSIELEYSAIQSLTEDLADDVRNLTIFRNVGRNINQITRRTDSGESGCREEKRFIRNGHGHTSR